MVVCHWCGCNVGHQTTVKVIDGIKRHFHQAPQDCLKHYEAWWKRCNEIMLAKEFAIARSIKSHL